MLHNHSFVCQITAQVINKNQQYLSVKYTVYITEQTIPKPDIFNLEKQLFLSRKTAAGRSDAIHFRKT